MMKVQIHAPYDYLCRDLDFALKKGLHPEIYFSADHLDGLKEDEARELARALKENGLTVTFHAPFRDLSPAAHDSKIRAVTRERLAETLALARFFHPRIVVCHPGFFRWSGEEKMDAWVERGLETWLPLTKEAEKLGTILALENVYEQGPAPLARLLERANSPWLGFCLDVGHLNVFSSFSLPRWVRRLGRWLVEIHLHDNRGRQDEHLPIGQGTADLAQLFPLLERLPSFPVIALEPIKKKDLEAHFQGLANLLVASSRSGKSMVTD